MPKFRPFVVLAASGALLAAACSSSAKPSTTAASTGAGSSTTATNVTAPAVVNIGYVADMQVPDPDVFYEIEGNSVMTSVYEGLVAYGNNTTQIIPALATSWEISTDGLTYTFHLRPGVMFHDGTTMTANDAKVSFMRRTALGAVSAPGYMLANVTGYDTPDPMTFVIHLNMPVAPFMDYLAAPYGPKVSSAATLAAHAGSDMDQTYLKTHDAGTGAFTMSEFVPGDHYTLTAFPGWWFGKPAVSQIKISILPDVSTQQLKLQSGDLQMIIHGLAKNDIASYEHNPKFQVQRFPANFKSMLLINENKGVFKSQPLRNALQQVINKQQIINDVYGSDGSLSTQFYPAGELPAGLGGRHPQVRPVGAGGRRFRPGQQERRHRLHQRRRPQPTGGGDHPDRAAVGRPQRHRPGHAHRGRLRPPPERRAGARPAAVHPEPRRLPPRHVGPHLLPHQ